MTSVRLGGLFDRGALRSTATGRQIRLLCALAFLSGRQLTKCFTLDGHDEDQDTTQRRGPTAVGHGVYMPALAPLKAEQSAGTSACARPPLTTPHTLTRKIKIGNSNHQVLQGMTRLQQRRGRASSHAHQSSSLSYIHLASASAFLRSSTRFSSSTGHHSVPLRWAAPPPTTPQNLQTLAGTGQPFVV